MGWVTERFSETVPAEAATLSPSEQAFDLTEENVWNQLSLGFEADVKEINAFKEDGSFKTLSRDAVRISSATTKIAVVVTADFEGHTIHYTYEPEDAQTAVPEQGVLTMRQSPGGIDLYSADERLTPDRARRLILEPLFFVNPPLAAAQT